MQKGLGFEGLGIQCLGFRIPGFIEFRDGGCAFLGFRAI